MPDQLETIVQRMIDAGESEENIASVIREFHQPQAPSASSTPKVAAGLGAMAATPAVLAGVNAAARAVAGSGLAAKSLPVLGYAGAAQQAAKGNVTGAITAAGATAAGNTVLQKAGPAVATALARATGPISPMAAGARVLSRLSGAASLPFMIASSLYDNLQYGQSQAAKLDDPNITAREKDQILQQLHSAGGF